MVASNDDTPAWEVINQAPDVGVNDANVFVQGVTVTFRTRSGAVGKVFIPQSRYTAEQARQIIGDAAGHAEAIANLKG